MHGACGVWGCLSVGIFAEARNICRAYGQCNNVVSGGRQFAVQLGGITAIVAWTCVTCGVMFFALAKAGVMRVSAEEEAMGLDFTEHGGAAHGAHAVSFMEAGGVKVEEQKDVDLEEKKAPTGDNEPANP